MINHPTKRRLPRSRSATKLTPIETGPVEPIKFPNSRPLIDLPINQSMESNQTIHPTAVENTTPAPKSRKGGWRPGSGRKPKQGVPAAIDAAVASGKPMEAVPVGSVTSRKSPLERLYDVMANPRVEWATRVRAMGLAAEYVHAKQPQAIHVTQDVRLAAVVVHTMPGPWEPKTVEQTRQNAPAAQLEPECGPPGLPEGCEAVPELPATNVQPAFSAQKQGDVIDSEPISVPPEAL